MSARTASESDTGSAPPGSWTYAMRMPSPIPAQTGTTWLWSEQQTTGMPSRPRTSCVGLLGVRHGVLKRRVRELHHVRAVLGAEVQPTREIHVEDVEPAGAEPEFPRLDVDDHLVAFLHRPGEAGVGDARRTVDLAADELRQPLDDRRHAPSPKRERHRAARATRRPWPRGRPRRCARRGCGSRPSRSRA